MHIHHTDVLVAGAGPVGLAAALFLHEQGLKVIIAEEKPGAVTHSYALALHPASLNLLEALGVVDGILARSRLVPTLAVYSGSRRLTAIPVAPASRAKHSCMAIAGQDVLESVLSDALKRRGVPTWWGHRLARFEQDPQQVSIQLDELEERGTGYAVARFDRLVARTKFVGANFLVGADGHGSLVRRQLGVDFNEVEPAQHFAVFEFQLDAPLPDEVALVLHDDGIGVLWPLPGNRARWSFAVDPARFPDASREKDHGPVQLAGDGIFSALDETLLERLVQARAPWFRAKITHLYWRIMVRFERRLVPEFGRGRVWLAGDAAHLTGPVGIQSMNVGLAEARALAGAIVRVGHHQTTGLLEQYNQDSLVQWRRLLGMEGSVDVTPDALPEVIRHQDDLLASLPGSGRSLASMAAGLGFRVDPFEFEVPGMVAGA